MAFRLEHLHRAFAAENELAFTAWAYATREPITAVTAKGYFHGCYRQFRVGDLIFCATAQPEPDAARADGGGRQRSLLLVTRMDPGGIETRLAQDWGTPKRAPPHKPRRGPAGRPDMAGGRSRSRRSLPTVWRGAGG